MKDRKRSVVVLLILSIAVAVAGFGMLSAQPAPSVKRSILLKQDMTIPGREVVMAAVELPPGAAEGRHTHPAEVYAFVQEGTISLEVEGKPTVTLKAGDIFTIAPGQIHQAINNGSTTARLSAVFIAEKGKPLTTPVK